jgi:hypothetical protein
MCNECVGNHDSIACIAAELDLHSQRFSDAVHIACVSEGESIHEVWFE